MSNTTAACSLRHLSSGDVVVRIIVGMLLITAAGLKTHELLTSVLSKADVRFALTGSASLIIAQSVLGLWLMSGLWSQRSWMLTLVLFTGFASYSLMAGIRGHTSCGCFGGVKVSPWITLLIDVTAIGLLVNWPPVTSKKMPDGIDVDRESTAVQSIAHHWGRVLTALVFSIGMGSIVGWTSLGNTGRAAGPAGSTDLVVLEPDEWVGRRLPILNEIDIGDQLSYGSWSIILYHHDCPKCQEVITKLETSGKVAGNGEAYRTALIEMAPYGAGSDKSAAGRLHLHGRLSDKNWFAQTPAAIGVVEGIVVNVSL